MTELEWHDVDSSRIVAEAYDADAEVICVRFLDGVEYCYFAHEPGAVPKWIVRLHGPRSGRCRGHD